MTNLEVRINKVIASYYGHETDIPNMPDFAGTWIVTEETFEFWIGIMRQDLERETSDAYYPEDRRRDLISAWRRQIVTLEKARPTDEPIAEPAGRAEYLAAEQARWEAWDNR